MGILDSISAITVGRPGGNLPIEKFDTYNQTLLNIVKNEFGLTDLPIVTNMDFGHTDPIFTIPLGLEALLDCDNGTIEILESAVS